MNARYENGLYIIETNDPMERELLRTLGVGYDRRSKLFVTPFGDLVAKVIPGFKPQSTIDTLAKSHAADSTFNPPCPPGLNYLPYQKAGIEWCSYRTRSLLGDDMGLGKTVQAIGTCNVTNPRTVLIVCPASLKLNWVKEWNKWTTTGIMATLEPSACWVVNYEQLVKHQTKIKSMVWDCLILDEAHYLKNKKAGRTRQVFGGWSFQKKVKGQKVSIPGVRPIQAHRVVALTGTPMDNRPIELYPLLKFLMPAGFPNELEYAKRYCGAYHNGRGWDFTGSTNQEELQEKLRSTVMIRRKKAQVLKELPPKVRQVIQVDPDTGMTKFLKHEKRLLGFIVGSEDKVNDQNYRELILTLLEEPLAGIAFEEMSEVRKEAALLKVPAVISHLKDCIASSGKVICFVHHREVADELKSKFDNAVMVVGGMSAQAKDDAVNAFQNDPTVELFIGNLDAAGVGLTLTASSHVVITETPWVPAKITQAEDRAHRFGQKNSVLVQHIVLARSIEATMAKRMINKQMIIDKTLDDEQFADIADILQ